VHFDESVQTIGVYTVLVGKPEGNRTPGRPKCKWGIILKWTFRKGDVELLTVSLWLRIDTGG
jgi:hypothetical protein